MAGKEYKVFIETAELVKLPLMVEIVVGLIVQLDFVSI